MSILLSILCVSCYIVHSYFSCRAVVDHSIGKELPSVAVESFEYFPGRGLTATLNGTKVRLLSRNFSDVHLHIYLHLHKIVYV